MKRTKDAKRCASQEHASDTRVAPGVVFMVVILETEEDGKRKKEKERHSCYNNLFMLWHAADFKYDNGGVKWGLALDSLTSFNSPLTCQVN